MSSQQQTNARSGTVSKHRLRHCLARLACVQVLSPFRRGAVRTFAALHLSSSMHRLGGEFSTEKKESYSMIGIYIVTKNMTIDQHTKGRARLQEAGAPETAMKLHSCFGEDGSFRFSISGRAQKPSMSSSSTWGRSWKNSASNSHSRRRSCRSSTWCNGRRSRHTGPLRVGAVPDRSSALQRSSRRASPEGGAVWGKNRWR